MTPRNYGISEATLKRLAEEIVRSRKPEKSGLLEQLTDSRLSSEDRESVREILADALVEEGLGPDDEPNSRGRLIEMAIDWIGRQ